MPKKIKPNLLSSTSKKGKRVTQILTNINGVKKTIHGIKTETIEQSQFTKYECEDGRMVLVNDSLTWIVEVFTEQ